MTDEEFISQLQKAKKNGAAEEFRRLMQGQTDRLIALAAKGVEKPPKRSKKSTQPVLPGTEFPSWWPTEAWNRFLENRKAKKAMPTPGAIDLIVKKLTAWRGEGYDPAAILDRSTENGYRGVFKPESNISSAQMTSQPKFEPTSLAGWQARVSAYYEGDEENGLPKGIWPVTWGGAPGSSDFRGPPQILEHYRFPRPNSR